MTEKTTTPPPGTQEVHMNGVIVTAKPGERPVTADDFYEAKELVESEQKGRVKRAWLNNIAQRLIDTIKRL